MSTVIIFGGAGYIGRNWAKRLAADTACDRIILADIVRAPESFPPKLEFRFCDVRENIRRQIGELKPDWIFNFAAVHREPGHQPAEYFDTNLAGARNACEFAKETDCSNLLFTSSISVYGPTRGETGENAPTYPTTPYGISKLCAEFIHEGWLRAANNRRLIVCRPGVVYGPGDPGNVLRMIRAVQRGYFFFPGSTAIRKSYAYVEGLLDTFEFAMTRPEPFLRYNYVEAKTEPIGQMVQIIRQQLGCSAPVISVPAWLLQPVAAGVQLLTKGRSPIHPARVRKAATPTHIVPQRLKDLGFAFKYDFRSSLTHWQSICPEDFVGRREATRPGVFPVARAGKPLVN
jgi:nucleoside-diphosphate-sugar epimerase